jgi:putative ubiquitin-RnfH superfamily antitoxin RatB of RatAB toxin-antitoxin module
LSEAFPREDLAALQAGVWGKPVARDHRVREGDRVELYRPLEIDPKEARRLKVGR